MIYINQHGEQFYQSCREDIMSIKRRLEKLEVKLLPPEPPVVYARIIIDGETQEAGIVRWMGENGCGLNIMC